MRLFFSNYLDDILVFSGLALIAVGLYQIKPTIAVLFVGVILLIGGVLVGLRRSSNDQPPGK